MNSADALEEARRKLAADQSEDVPCLNLLLESVSTIDEGLADPADGDSRQGRFPADQRRQTFRSSFMEGGSGVLVLRPAEYFGRRQHR
jgi:hypothetical protein